MQVSKKTPVKQITVQGFNLQAPAPYAEGHTLTETEAAVLNQTLAENLRNNFGSQIKKTRDEVEADGGQYSPDTKELQKAFDDYIAEYEFGAKRTGGAIDPTERKARAMAKDVIKRAIQNKGAKIKDVGNEKITELANSYYEANSEALLTQARDVIAAEARAQEAMASVSVDL